MCVWSERDGWRTVVFGCVSRFGRLILWVSTYLDWWVGMSDLIWGSEVDFG